MKATFILPEGYRKLYDIDLKQKRLAILVNLLALVIAVALVIPGALSVPLTQLWEPLDSPISALRPLALGLACFVYIPLHELIHGIFIRYYSGKRANYGFTLMYAYAGSDAWFAKIPYFVIALAPVVIWGVVLAILQLLVSAPWFWVVYGVQIINLSGAAGDLYVFFRLLQEPADILVRDTGTAMTVYCR